MLAVEQRGGAEDLVHGDHAGAADAGHEHVGGARHLQRGLRKRPIDSEDRALFLSRLAPGNHGQERRAVAAQARVVLVAGGLVDLRLAPELGVHRLDGQAVRLHAAVAAALADRLVDEHAQRGVLEPAALAQAALLGSAALIVDEDGHAGNVAQEALRLVEAVAVPHLGAAAPARARIVFVGFVAGDDDALDALGLEQARHVRHRHGARRVLAARHGHRGVVEDLERDVRPRRHRLADRQRARVEEGAVAEILEHVRHLGERRHADPLHALTAHVRGADRVTLGHRQRHAVAADAAAGHRAVRHHRRPVVRAARAEERLAGKRQRLRALPQRFEQGHPSRDGTQVDLLLQARGEQQRDPVGVELAVGGHERPVLLVLLADHEGPLALVVERLADEGLHERPLLLDDEQFLEPARELPHDLRLHRPEQPDLQQADAVAPQPFVVQAELAQGLAHVVVGLAGGRDAEPRPRRRHRDLVERVRGRERLRGLDPPVVQLALQLEAEGRQQHGILRRAPGLAFPREAGIADDETLGMDHRGADLVGDVGDDLEAHPEPGVARHLEAVAAEVEDLLHVAGEECREERVVEGDLGVRRQRGGLRERIVAAEGEHAAPASDARVVRVLEDVAGAVDARPLAIPHTQHAVVLRPRKDIGELRAVDRRRAEILVEAGDEDDVVLGQELRVALEREVETTERRAAVTRDQRRRAHAAAHVGAVLVQRQPDERLDARQEDGALVQAVLGVEREIVVTGHASPRQMGSRPGPGRMIRARAD